MFGRCGSGRVSRKSDANFSKRLPKLKKKLIFSDKDFWWNFEKILFHITKNNFKINYLKNKLLFHISIKFF